MKFFSSWKQFYLDDLRLKKNWTKGRYLEKNLVGHRRKWGTWFFGICMFLDCVAAELPVFAWAATLWLAGALIILSGIQFSPRTCASCYSAAFLLVDLSQGLELDHLRMHCCSWRPHSWVGNQPTSAAGNEIIVCRRIRCGVSDSMAKGCSWVLPLMVWLRSLEICLKQWDYYGFALLSIVL